MRYREVIDPYGAPEFFVTGVGGHEFASPGVLRFLFDAEDVPDQARPTILRVRLLMPVPVIPQCMLKTARFLAAEGYELPPGIRLS